MRGVVYKGPYKVDVEQVPDPKIEHPNDVILKITSTCICGSDLHMYEGRTPAQPGLRFGHEPMGVVEEVGNAVTTLRKGDRVVAMCNVACGFCKNCERGLSGYCLTVNPGFAGAAYGFAGWGPFPGGQSDYLRVPYADYNALKVPQGTEHEEDFALLADIFPTGYHGTELAKVSIGESVVVFGAGPVGEMVTYSAMLRGAAEVYVVDHIPERLDKVKALGAIPIDFSKGDPVEQIKSLRHGDGVDKGIDAVGYQAINPATRTEDPAYVLNVLIELVNATGILGMIGLYVTNDPGAKDPHAAHGELLISWGKLWEKGLSLGSGQVNVKLYQRHLRDLIIAGRAKPSFVVSHELPLNDAPLAYEKFDKRVDGFTKVILKP
jgi:glutathione-independent formaldehyde dehydrogenase